jgi:hypothetical protein
MTQDAPLDQKAPIDADVLRKLVPGFRLDWSGLRNRFDDIAARLDKLTTYESRAAYLDEIARNFEDAVSDALSRRVPASGGEHPDDLAVDRFAAMKLAGHRNITTDTIEELRSKWRQNPAMPAYQRLVFDGICDLALLSLTPPAPKVTTDEAEERG